MSYTIEYARVFLRSGEGITPCWLAGDNNVTTSFYRGHERRARDWSVFANMLGASEEELMDFARSMTGGPYQEHWKRNGKWVDDAGVIRWMERGIKDATPIEALLAANRMGSVRCRLSVWQNHDNREELNERVSTTEELDAWIIKAKARMTECKSLRMSCYPIIDFSTEKLIKPSAKRDDDELVLFKKGNAYLTEVSESGSTWVRDARKAKIYTAKEAAGLKAAHRYGWIQEAKLVSADVAKKPHNYILQFVDGPRAGFYVERRTSSRIWLASVPAGAKHYPDKQAAVRAMKAMQPAVERRFGKLAVIQHV